MSKEADALYDEMCRVVGQAVMYLCDTDIETKKHNIANVLETALLSNSPDHTEQMRKAMQAAINVLTRF
ncbi:DUF2767 family protein [Enterobacter cloacae]|uniref:DUF2767 family protein n=1 Tax=Enterobacter cloacae TaxID=550 RepID=UPI002B214F84|nr:DUF2767 family protein [Enterobacter cloacae]MEA5215288.1 DUF2767 family protein [Enterobacter cloacae]